jgi:hypothetical protein
MGYNVLGMLRSGTHRQGTSYGSHSPLMLSFLSFKKVGLVHSRVGVDAGAGAASKRCGSATLIAVKDLAIMQFTMIFFKIFQPDFENSCILYSTSP